jgi:hypothetical protein
MSMLSQLIRAIKVVLTEQNCRNSSNIREKKLKIVELVIECKA